MKALFKMAMIASFAIIASNAVYGQDWTKAQKDVWQVVENNWAKWISGDLDGLALNIHEKYQGWSSIMPLPLNKEELFKLYRKLKETSKVENLNINPARISVTDNSAVVDYYFSFQITPLTGEKKIGMTMTGKYVEFYVKEGNRWLLMGDMTVYDENNAK